MTVSMQKYIRMSFLIHVAHKVKTLMCTCLERVTSCLENLETKNCQKIYQGKGRSQENVKETCGIWKIAQVDPHLLDQTVV